MAPMRPAHERFARWFAESGLTKVAVALEVGCSPVFVGYILRGERDPGLAIAHGIERLTAAWPEGAIRTEEWIPPSHTESVPPTEPAGQVR